MNAGREPRCTQNAAKPSFECTSSSWIRLRSVTSSIAISTRWESFSSVNLPGVNQHHTAAQPWKIVSNFEIPKVLAVSQHIIQQDAKRWDIPLPDPRS